MRRFLVAAAILLGTATAALACLWDRDTLREEAKGLPEAVAAIVGRFPRNPPLYYEMRLARVAKRIESNPEDLEAYDDAGVACDRLSRGDEAVAWMAKKRTALDAMPEGSKVRREHEYRYHANLGTFLVHRWIRAGADRAKLDEVRAASEQIGRALAINPDAHFGREIYQKRFLDWLIDPPDLGGRWSTLPNFLGIGDIHEQGPRRLQPEEAHRAVRGLVGLIVLGNAWESVDVYHALRFALGQDTQGMKDDGAGGGRNSLAYLAWLRCKELIDAGKSSMIPSSPRGEGLIKSLRSPGYVKGEDSVQPFYKPLREEADRWQEARTAFMMVRLRQGRHPDDDPRFWDGYVEAPAPDLPDVRPESPPKLSYVVGLLLVFLLGATVVLAVVVGFVMLIVSAGRRRYASRKECKVDAEL